MTTKAKESKASTCGTGIAGLDDILGGGLPRNRVYLVQGDPGVGKTTLGLQFLLEGVKQGESVLYITLSETKEEILEVADSHGWDLQKIHLFELSSLDQKLRGETESTFFHPSEIELNRTTQTLLDEVERVNPMRVVFDSLSEMRLIAETALRYRRQILQLKQYFAGRKCTVLFLDDRTSEKGDLQVESIAHGVIALTRASPAYGITRRQLNVMKVRGRRFQEGNHDVTIETGGLVVFPRLITAKHHTEFVRENFASGIKGLDLLLGGGLGRGTSSMFMGPPGTGKTTLAIKFAYEAASRKEKVLYFMFDETVATMLSRAASLGMDLEAFIKQGLICVEQVDPAEIAPGELGARISESVESHGTRMVVLDSINGYLNAMPEKAFLNLQLHELLTVLNQRGVITIMLLAQQGVIGNMQTVVDLTYLADTVIMLRYFESRGEVKQAVSIIKKRSGDHERTIREMKIGGAGITVGEPLRELHGVLTGVPSFERGKSSRKILESE